MEYGYFLAGEVAEEDLAGFQRGAEGRKLIYSIRRDFDLIQINGYTFSSFGAPADLPPNLVLSEYEGDVGMYLVQFKGPMANTWWRALQAVGEVVGYYPENTYLVRAAKSDMPVLRRVSGVQHVSLYQPAYKVQRWLLERDELVLVDFEFDGGQDLNAAAAAVRIIVDEDVPIRQVDRFAYARTYATRINREAIVRRPEVLWVEPALSIEPSGERGACVTAGEHDGIKPVRPDDPMGYQSWLEDKGFCLPTTELNQGETCMAYWQKVGVIDTGLDITKCPEDSYTQSTGYCSDPDPDNERHWDLNHKSNTYSVCQVTLAGGGESLDPMADCQGKVIGNTFHCAATDFNSHCKDDGESFYDFSDWVSAGRGHGTGAAMIIAGDSSSLYGDNDPGYLDAREDPDGFFRGIGIAPSAQIIPAVYRGIDSTHYQYDDLMSHVDFGFLSRRITVHNGARFLNCSWNVKHEYDYLSERQYTLFSKVADMLVRDGDYQWAEDEVNRGTTITFSAGNTGYQQGPGEEVQSPGTAKNVITVGATEGFDPPIGDPPPPYGEPLCGYSHDDGYVIGNIASFSRRAFINEDGSGAVLPRYKPDLVAAGSHDVSANSRYPDAFEPYYWCFGGTSAAAAETTASAVLAETWYWYKLRNPYHPDDKMKPSPAMIKAMLVAHADNLAGGMDSMHGSTLENSPSVPQGWGRVNLGGPYQVQVPEVIGGLFQDDVPVVVFDQDDRQYPLDPEELELPRRFTETGQVWSFQLQVNDPTKPFVAVLVYTDNFSWPAAASLKVNDLHLNIVKYEIGPPGSGHCFWGNNFEEDSWYSEDHPGVGFGTVPWDSNNTVEVVRVRNETLEGMFWVYVKTGDIASNAVPGLDDDNPNQDFALYIFNAEPW